MIAFPHEFDPAEAQRRKSEALAILEARRELIILRSRRALLAAMLAQGEATADDVRQRVKLPPGINPKCFGAVPGSLARAGIIGRAAFTTTKRSRAHARPLSIWELLDADAARLWLARHPDAADPDDDDCCSSPTLFTPIRTCPTVAAAGPLGGAL